MDERMQQARDLPPFLYLNPAEGNRVVFDPTDKLGGMYMLDHDFKGCLTLPFSKEVVQDSGSVLLSGEPVPFLVKKICIMSDVELYMLGIRLAGLIVDGGVSLPLEISGFRDLDGRTMAKTDLTVVTEPQARPRPEDWEHEAIALQAAEEGIVLLKNQDQALPLEGKVVNAVGEGVYFFQTCAVGAGKINARYQVDFRQAVLEDPEVSLNGELADFFRSNPCGVPGDDLLRRAAEQSDTAVMLLVRASGENMDNSTAPGEYTLADHETELLKALGKHFRKTVLVLNTGYPIAMDFTETCPASAILVNGFGGMLAGKALLNVLTGRTTPSGRLTSTWARTYADLPTSGNFYDCAQNGMQRYTADTGPELTTCYAEGLFMGYRYFTSTGKPSFYPFGYGLSYTTFEETVLEVKHTPGRDIRVTVLVENTGHVSGKHVVQLYVGKKESCLTRPVRELAAFGKTGILAPGDTETLVLTVEERNLDFFSADDQAYILEAGTYTLYLGADAEHVRETGEFVLPETVATRQTAFHLTGRRTTPGYSGEPLYPGVESLSVRDLIRLYQPDDLVFEELFAPATAGVWRAPVRRAAWQSRRE